MIKEFEYKGKWWLPDKPEEQISGTLKYSPVNGAILDLIESFKKNRDINQLLQPDIISGNSSDGKEITLHKCFETSFNIGSPGFTSSSFYANIVIIGQHFPKPEDIKFRNLSVNYQYFEEWSKIGVFSYHRNPGETFKKYEVKYEAPEPVEAKIDNFKISFAHNFNVSGDWLREVNLKRTTFIKIEPEHELHFEEYQNILYHLQNFLSLATMRAIYPLSIKATTEQNKIISPFSNGKVHYPSIDIFYNVMGKQDLSKKLTHYDMLFTFEDISGQFETYIQNWFGKADKLKPVYDLFFGTLYNPSMYLELQFLSLIQAIESFHRRRYGGEYLLGEKCLFSWDNVPGNDSERLTKFLRDELDIEWVENAKIHKPNGNRTICISNGENSAKIKISKNEGEATLEIGDNKTPRHLKVKKENGKLKIYYEDYANVRYVLEKAIPDWVEKDHKKSLKSRIEYGNEFSLRTRLKKIFDKYQENLSEFIENKNAFIEKVVDTRNYLTHYDKKEKAAIGEELDPIIQKLKILLEICLLTELGFSTEEIKKLFSRNRRFQYE